MEVVQAEVVVAGTPPLPSAQVVSKVLSQGRSNDTFLNNAGIPDCSSRSHSSGEGALHSQLAAKKEGFATLQEQIEVLKKESENKV
ncbi:hypothetical protein HU200_013558 [Digitaria exilis]|uniref:Uncharacterized protein n=1 Tax=Digitaria exilis TaxID=1010633 RepID=A0A835FCV4_9POAL|nr:hypothetical protein HU200_013558 [Digitaria exilis]